MSSLPRSLRSFALAVALGVPLPAAAQAAGDHIDVTVVTVEGINAQDCGGRTARLAEQSRTLSLATSPPYDLAPGLRTFYDHVLRLDSNGELSSTAQLSTVYVTGYTSAGEPMQRAVSPFVRVEVARPAGTPADAPSRLSISWLWLQRLAQSNDPAGRIIERPFLHRFDFVGEVTTTYGTWGQAVAPCRTGTDGTWVGAVAVWTYLPP
ncbi:hypothetical protein GWK16_12650 [Roseomonas sp. JC162]|uniref:Uncharacterized protein n=1 Tax=Neoroseomonas marina TaxID=1232220 RepID=A0A848EDI9_9PROT|nr:hypothetical protein [Neoroseomonas marina]NMJ42096.1 hypothetical protein [Neoroseomonas marina]